MFNSPLVLQEADIPDFWILAKPLVWAGSASSPPFIVPVGFMTDLASIPRGLRNLPSFDPNGRSRRAAVGHDWLYWWQGWGKTRADDFLREAMLAEGCGVADAEAFWLAVHLGGGSSWDDGTKRGLASHFNTPADYAAWLASVPSV